MKDIARDLGVSQMTVSKALRNHSDISEQTRERVLKRMRELNYQPDWIARSMVTAPHLPRRPRAARPHALLLRRGRQRRRAQAAARSVTRW